MTKEINMYKVALVQDYLAQMGGAERVTEVLHQMLPDADLYTTLAVPDRLSSYLREAQPKTTWMQSLPAKSRLYRHYFFLYPFGIEAIRLDDYDLIVSSCCGYAKGVKRHLGAVHVCYCHNPMRWVWRFSDYVSRDKFNGLTKLALSAIVKGLKQWEKRAATRPDFYIANSRIVADRLRSAFGVEAEVIEPPIVTSRFKVSAEIDDYYLILSRLVPYKRVDLAVEACTRTGRKLVVIGDGSDRARLEKMAGPTVTFLGRQNDATVDRYASRCLALILPGEEDFGMAPLEINAAGRPVVAYGAGGATETIIGNLNGVLFRQQSVESLIEALEECESKDWDATAIRCHALRYDVSVFQERMLSFLAKVSPVIQELPARQTVVA
jgi:glycosyltransferase involved in cell wall biosynthesis